MNEFPASGILVTAIFIVCLGTTVLGAVIAVASGRLIRSVSGLAICSVGLAGLFYFLHSPFLAVMEILIYIGAVCVTIIFAIMLAEPDEPARSGTPGSGFLWGSIAALGAAAIFFGLSRLGTDFDWPTPERTGDGSVAAIGIHLLTTYSMAFELISLALMVAILGALAIARMGRTKDQQT
jgi:NADH:ubiquinone oxidoreductase subunit 6 (subunit J)